MQFRPEKDTPDNTKFNYHVSKVRIRSEHCMGFIKGRWSSLRGLRVQINEPLHIQFASLWITSCIVLHTFAMRYESGLELSTDEFYLEGVRIMAAEKILIAAQTTEAEAGAAVDEAQREAVRDIELLEGRLKRENLKRDLFAYLY